MKSVSISGSLRKSVGRKDANLSRKQGQIPCVIYGGNEQMHFTLDEKLLEKIITSPDVYIVSLNIDGRQFESIIQEQQFHPVTDRVVHVDFLQIIPGKPIVVKIPVICKGSSEGVLKGGVLVKKIKKITLKALPDALPENITLDISKLDIGDSIRVSDIKLENIQILEIPNAVVVGVRTARTVVEEVSAEGAATAEGTAAAEGAATAEGAAAAKGGSAAAKGAAPAAAPAGDAGKKGQEKAKK